MSMLELRDLKGNFILGWILGINQIVVLRSNISNSMEILVKPNAFSWGDAAQDPGSGTALSPFALLEATRMYEERSLDEDMKSDIGGEG